MAWIDDRIWCHTKFADLSDHAFTTYVKSVAYSSGMACRGYLTAGHQKHVGATPRGRKELINAGLWDITEDGKTIYIHDWDEHNSKRDDRRERDRERKKQARMSGGTSTGKSADNPQDAPQDKTADVHTNGALPSTVAARVDGSDGSDGSEGSEGSEGTTKPSFLPSVVKDPAHEPEEGRQNLLDRDRLNPLAVLAHHDKPPF